MTAPLPARPLEILLVEDEGSDVLLARLALERCALPCRVQVAWDGLDALSLLHREPPHQQAPPPDLILLDLHLPRMDGVQLLAALQHEPEMSGVPVVVLTTSPADLGLLGDLQDLPRLYLEKPISERRMDLVFRELFGAAVC